MTTPYIPEDCIYEILKYLQNSCSTLFNCLLVNRFWCKATVPLLYADPFGNKFSLNKKYLSIISTLISCFSKEEILQLKNQLKLINIDNKIININDEYKQLFEYPKYLENFDYHKLNTVIFNWLDLSIYKYRDNDKRKKLHENFIPTLYHSILRRIISIKHLNISLELFKIWNVQVNLTKLISLDLHLFDLDVRLNSKITTEFLSNMANSCLNLRKLEMTTSLFYADHYTDFRTIEKLCAIIKKQNNLKEIILSSYYSDFINDILLSLEFQKHSLIYIELKDVNFSNISFKNFINLCNLKYLKFHDCDGATISLDQCEALKYVSFKLEKLEICNDELGWNFKWDNDNITSLMIKYLGTSLQELILSDEANISIIENISTYCLNLIKLEIKIGPNINLLMFPYFKNLKIRTLNISFSLSFNHVALIKYLASNIPTNVKEVSLSCAELSCIEEFLENCHYYLEIINLKCSIELEILKIISNYIERSNNSLKVFGIGLGKILNDEELKLLNQIETKGVKIMGFYKGIFECI